MALSMDEQRMLAEIERRLSAEDPGLAARLSSFRRPGPTLALRSPRVRIIGSILTVALVAVVSLMVYAMVPLRTHYTRTPGRAPQATPAARRSSCLAADACGSRSGAPVMLMIPAAPSRDARPKRC